ncbi:response regulator [Candidatus Thiodiazotropha sp. CDECU1]|uniref:response regulator n=1 Tax=Candidatus Thiodiazotropha sp. CDECU1 TaxID=3065865 RepID=UPI002931180E|nr:response regulator [Candidatus Thiodiazotropha sp. CDECU1]
MTAKGDSNSKHLLQQFPEILTHIQANWPVLPSGMWNATGVRSVLRYLNDLTRKSRQAGLVNIHQLSQAIDKVINDIFQEDAQPDSEELDRLNHLLEKLKQAIAASQSANAESGAVSSSYDLIYLHKKDSAKDQITSASENNGWRVLSLDHVDDLHTALVDGKAKVMLVDTDYIQEMGEVNQLLEELRSQKKRRPELIFLSDRCDIEIRLEVLRTGVTQCFSNPININDLMLSIKQVIAPEVIPHYRVLVVEDDESQAKFACALLRKGGMECLAITDPLNVMEAVDQFQPDLILMDLYMPGANGIELTQVIRERDETLTIPIVFLSGEDDLEKKLLALHSGADDFLTKPVRPQHLLATVKTRINRAKQIFTAGSRGLIDHSTGLRNRRELLQQLDISHQVMQNGVTVYALFSITLADHEQHPHIDESEELNDVVLDVADLVGALISKRDIIARTTGHSLGVLIQCSTEAEIEAIGKSFYEQLDEALVAGSEAADKNRFGIGVELIDDNQLDAYLHLKRAETASLQAYQQGYEGFLHYKEQAADAETSQHAADDFQKQQLLNALKTGLIEFQEQRFSASFDVGKVVMEQLPVPAPATDIVLISDDIHLTAERYGISDLLDQYICKHAIKRLGDYALQGEATQLIVHLSAHAANDETILECLKSELRRLQLVGTGLMVEFNLPSLASNLKQARHFLGELSAMGIATLLGNFACNETAYKVLAYLKADGVRPHVSLMQTNAEKIQDIATQVHSLHAKIILPAVKRFGQISLHWSEAADYVQTDYSELG